MIEAKGKYNTAKIFTDNIEDTAYGQILELCNQQAFEGTKIRIMPDTHAGKGCVIGFTAELQGKVVPNLIGVDIGCGMTVTDLGKIDINFNELDNFIRNNIPHGNSINQKRVAEPIGNGLMDKITVISSKTNTQLDKHVRSLGSLGGGNHFIEINEDSAGNKYLVIHSGSRNLGLQVAKYHQKKAEEYCESKTKELRNQMNKEIGLLKQSGNHKDIQAVIDKYEVMFIEYRVPKSLMFLEGELAEEYLNDMYAAQEFAMWNRQTMAKTITDFLGVKNASSFSSVHNYIDPSDNIIRKGATRAKKGEKLIIPINMRDGSIIAIGKGNEDWNNSAPHGAGRILSRSKAKEVLSLDEFKSTMNSVWTSSVGSSTIDEAPMAYKPLEEIVNNTGDTVEILEIIKPLYNFKASE
ncbi:MAG: RtcB family protein [Bacillota bacterium]